jgi:hypothetical protein
LHVIGNNAQIKNIYYFSGLAIHLQTSSPLKIIIHKHFINELKSANITGKPFYIKKEKYVKHQFPATII